jgi:hypothetical protein
VGERGGKSNPHFDGADMSLLIGSCVISQMPSDE